MPLVRVKALSELPPGTLAEIQVNGSAFAICNVDGSLHCVDGVCPHAGGPLGEGNLDGENIVCPWHCWSFNCKTGANDLDEEVKLQTYPVVVQDGSILIDLP
jgi:nitrite reductase (NADH) small subunit